MTDAAEPVVVMDIAKAARLKALRSRLADLRHRGDERRASQCADLILELIGKRSAPLPAVIA